LQRQLSAGLAGSCNDRLVGTDDRAQSSRPAWRAASGPGDAVIDFLAGRLSAAPWAVQSEAA
jgi:hypothetical protein